MGICKAGLRIAGRHPIYLIIYMVVLSMLGVFTGLSASGGGAGQPAGGDEDQARAYQSFEGTIAVIDRDDSDLSRALAAYLGDRYQVADVPDEPFALQDALACGTADCVIIIPAGYGDDLLKAAHEGADGPELEYASGFSPQAGALVSQTASRWASLARAAAVLEPARSAENIARIVKVPAGEQADVELAEAAEGSPTQGFATYLKFSSYSLTSTIIVCAGVVLLSFSQDGPRRRNAASPVPLWRVNAGQLGAALILALAAWAWTSALGCAVFADAVAVIGPQRTAVALGLLLAFALTPLALAFLLTRFSIGEEGLNACGNIVGMAMSFLGGAWVPLALMGGAVQAAARFSPVFWANDAIEHALSSTGTLGASAVASIAADLGVTLLFAAAIAAAGFAIARARRRA